ncbi:MAG: hypothetical protein ACD_52C00008G0001 [uncultured bacterium]|nr:MAG: hypothetical protein ACD_52C00008G0001 [uncultured bacterium]
MGKLLEPVRAFPPLENGLQPVALALKETDHARELKQARVLKTWKDKRDLNLYFDDFVQGLARIGSFDLSDSPVQLVMKRDGTTVPDPTDAILTGHADASPTVDFILSRISQIDLSESGEAMGQPIGVSVRVYNQYREALVAKMRTRDATRSNLQDQWKHKALFDHPSQNPIQALSEWSENKGTHYQSFLQEQELSDQQLLPNLKKLLQRLGSYQLPVDSYLLNPKIS